MPIGIRVCRPFTQLCFNKFVGKYLFLCYRSQLYLKFKDELDQVETRAQPIIQEFRRLVEENANLDVSLSLSLSLSRSVCCLVWPLAG